MDTVYDLVKKNLQAEPQLSFDKQDIERRIGFPAGRFTNTGPLLAPLSALAVTVLFFGALRFSPDSLVTQMFTRRSFVPYFIVFLAAWACAILFIKRAKISLQRRALSLKLLPSDDPGFTLTAASAEQVLGKLFQSVDDPQRFLLTRRIHNALSNLKNMGRIADVSDVLQAQADNDEAQMDSSYTMLRGHVWAIPVFGFIGTVWGLSKALGRFGSVLANAGQMTELREALQGVTGGLATAFDTTFQGLIAVVGIHMLMIAVRRREEQFLDDCNDYCQKHVVGRLRLTGLDEQSK